MNAGDSSTVKDLKNRDEELVWCMDKLDGSLAELERVYRTECYQIEKYKSLRGSLDCKFKELLEIQQSQKVRITNGRESLVSTSRTVMDSQFPNVLQAELQRNQSRGPEAEVFLEMRIDLIELFLNLMRHPRADGDRQKIRILVNRSISRHDLEAAIPRFFLRGGDVFKCFKFQYE